MKVKKQTAGVHPPGTHEIIRMQETQLREASNKLAESARNHNETKELLKQSEQRVETLRRDLRQAEEKLRSMDRDMWIIRELSTSHDPGGRLKLANSQIPSWSQLPAWYPRTR